MTSPSQFIMGYVSENENLPVLMCWL